MFYKGPNKITESLSWLNLMQNLCPKCGDGLKQEGMLDPVIFCVKKCGFTISETRMNEIVADMHKKAEQRGKRERKPFFPNVLPTRTDMK